ncbi:carboxypeptidase regulatory-like domain-containing protein [Saccharospirillum salsuginis]|uniref:Prenyltransferase and squalene oxidase repeat-containing protein n=1 Tax=Saccharospirillum salsuginis TaxID=418750 RepID=A0A918KS72_9GAMM|nr:carboxypeptidase regulatory-like domain-containing protein [Saccharospirillum salsuginis]GGX73725.1 hypothetical protein GCM10007392_46510 [Saccharospirillum salsuginis]
MFSKLVLRFVSGCLVSFGLWFSHSALANTPVELGQSWLMTQIQGSGHIASDEEPTSEFASTAEAVFFLTQNGQANLDASVQILTQTGYKDTFSLAKKTIALALTDADSSDLVDQILSRRNSDGGFGAGPVSESTVADTATSLIALYHSDRTAGDVVDDATEFLLTTQGNDGFWRYSDGIHSEYLTAMVVRALWLTAPDSTQDVYTAILNARNSLLDSVDSATGLWSDLHTSAAVLTAIYPTYSDHSELTPYLKRLEARQQSDGSWNNSVFETALVLSALNSDVIQASNSETTGLKSSVENAQTATPVHNVDISIASPSNSYALNSPNGSFFFEDIDPGQYSIDVEAEGYQKKTLNQVTVDRNAIANLPPIKLVPDPANGIVLGTVTDGGSGLPIAGADIHVKGVQDWTATTSESGHFTLTGIDPGDIKLTTYKDGYRATSATATVTAGTTLRYSPTLSAIKSDASEPLPDTPSTSTVNFQVTTTDGQPIKYANVRYQLPASTDSGTDFTDTNGKSAIVVEQSGTLGFNITKSGFHPIEGSLTVTMGNNISAKVELSDQDSSNDGSLEETTQPQDGVDPIADLTAVVTDRLTGDPISGSTVELSGLNSETATTGINGEVQFESLSIGEQSLKVTAAGYLTEQGNITLYAGNRSLLNIELLEQTKTDERPGGISGSAVDAVNESDINPTGASLHATDTDAALYSLSIQDYVFSHDSVDPGTYRLKVDADGFETYSELVTVTAGTILKLDQIEMSRLSPSPVLYGQVVDASTGTAIENATITIVDGDSQAQSDSQGLYQLGELPTGDVDLLISAVGYTPRTHLLRLESPVWMLFNIELVPATGSGVVLTDSSLTDRSFNAYQTVNETLSVESQLSTATRVGLEMDLINQDENTVLSLLATDDSGNIIQNNGLELDANSTRDIQFSWNTSNLATGTYTAVYRVVSGNQKVGPNNLVLFEMAKKFDINQTRKVQEFELLEYGEEPAVGEPWNLAPIVQLSNGSNVDTDFQIEYHVEDPQGSRLYSSGRESVFVESGVPVKTVELLPHDLDVLQEGDYRLTVEIWESSWNSRADTLAIQAEPSIRIEIDQELSDYFIPPEHEKSITVNIRLEGKEFHGE